MVLVREVPRGRKQYRKQIETNISFTHSEMLSRKPHKTIPSVFSFIFRFPLFLLCSFFLYSKEGKRKRGGADTRATRFRRPSEFPGIVLILKQDHKADFSRCENFVFSSKNDALPILPGRSAYSLRIYRKAARSKPPIV